MHYRPGLLVFAFASAITPGAWLGYRQETACERSPAPRSRRCLRTALVTLARSALLILSVSLIQANTSMPWVKVRFFGRI